MHACMHEELYIIEFDTILFLFADILTRHSFKNCMNSSVHALPREIWHGYVSGLTRKSFFESYVLWSARKG